MSGGPKRNADKLNTIGVVVVGICGAVLVYVTIVALQAFYMDDTSEIQTMADYGGQDITARHIRQDQTGTLTAQSVPNAPPKSPAEVQTYRIPIRYAIKYVVEGVKVDPVNLIPIYGRPGPSSEVSTVLPVFGRGKPKTPPPGTGSGSGSADPGPPTPPTGAGSAAPPTGSPPPAGAGSADPKTPKKDTSPKTPANAGSAVKGNAR